MTPTETAACQILSAIDDKAREFESAGVDTFQGAKDTILSYLASNDPDTFQSISLALTVV